jgi:hypothetical protein
MQLQIFTAGSKCITMKSVQVQMLYMHELILSEVIKFSYSLTRQNSKFLRLRQKMDNIVRKGDNAGDSIVFIYLLCFFHFI